MSDQDATLEERVDRLIAKSNQSHQPNPGSSWDNSCNCGRPPFQPNPRSQVDFPNNRPPQQPQGYIRQNLGVPNLAPLVLLENLIDHIPSNASSAVDGAILKGYAHLS